MTQAEDAAPSLVAVTGGSGLIGSRVVPLLQQGGFTVRVLARSRRPQVSAVECVTGDVRDRGACEALVRGARFLVHLAGIAHTTLRSAGEREEARQINIDATRQLLAIAQQAGVERVIVASTAHVYSGQRGTGLSESSPTSGDTFYSSLKLDAEQAARDVTAAGLPCVVIRPCIVYGAGVRANLETLMRALQRGRYFHPGRRSTLRSFASVDTVASAIVHLLLNGKGGVAYNIADREPVYLSAWVDALAQHMGAGVPRTIPLGWLRMAAASMTPFAALGLPVPLSKEKLNKLTNDFALNTDALAATGFVWPSTEEEVMREMAATFLARASAGDAQRQAGR